MASELPRTMVCIPGRWSDHSELVKAIATQSGGYLFAGIVLMHLETKATFEVEIDQHNPDLLRAFQFASGGRLSDEELAAIADHTFALYVSRDGGSFESVRLLMEAAVALLECGGIAVKVESTGVAHSADRWRELTTSELPTSPINAFVTYAGGDGSYYSCGMHNLGHRDASVTADIPPDDAALLLDTFVRYVVLEEPTLHDGETFGIARDAPRYRIEKTPCSMFDPDDLFHNPYGMWNLTPDNPR